LRDVSAQREEDSGMKHKYETRVLAFSKEGEAQILERYRDLDLRQAFECRVWLTRSLEMNGFMGKRQTCKAVIVDCNTGRVF